MTKAGNLLSLIESHVTDTILHQLGGNMFLAMTGAKISSTLENTLSLYLPSKPNKVYAIAIKLTPADEYDMIFFDKNIRIIKEYNGIYADQLQSLFTKVTGMDTHL